MEEIKIISKDPLGDEVKKWEKSAEHLLDAKLPVVIRLDGRAFHAFTKNFHRPFDTVLHRAFIDTTKALIQESGASFFNDHIALRTFCSQNPLAGISSISRIFEALGYRAADSYNFEDKHLNAIYFQHPQPTFPKVFISELRTWELKPSSKHIIHGALKTHRTNLSESFLADLHHLETKSECSRESLLDEAVEFFHELKWHIPEKSDLLELNLDSQYAAWVLVHGYNVNHFTSLINSHKVPALDDIEKTTEALLKAGVPMKKEIEGARGSKLRQTATEAVLIDVPVLENG